MDFELAQPGDAEHFLSYAREQQRAKAETDPDIGDVVHLWHGNACRAAIVTADDLTTWSLSFLMPGETSWRCIAEVEHDEGKGDNTWHWPCGGH
ncbi:hypothetical protein EAO77_37915 [Streptomyces sp. t39]|nr:hypothetical protein EAO77_37915 [Streptomyces sp. t39]